MVAAFAAVAPVTLLLPAVLLFPCCPGAPPACKPCNACGESCNRHHLPVSPLPCLQVYTDRMDCCNVLYSLDYTAKPQGICAVPEGQWSCYIPLQAQR